MRGPRLNIRPINAENRAGQYCLDKKFLLSENCHAFRCFIEEKSEEQSEEKFEKKFNLPKGE
jgi:hypothetical protein